MDRKVWIQAAALLAFTLFSGKALAQDGVRAVYTGTQEQVENAARSNGSRPLVDQATPANPVITFNSAAVGIASSSAQSITATFTVSGYLGTFTPTATLHYGLSYSAGPISCTGTTSPESCTVTIAFQPNYPGGHRDALFLTNGSTRLATVLLHGIGQSPFALLQPGLITHPVTSGGYYYTGVVDESGTAYILETENDAVLSITKAGVTATLPITGLNSPRELGIDGAGVLYIADQTPKGSITTYDTVQGVQGTSPFNTAEFYNQGVAVGNTGNIYLTDSINIYTMPIVGSGTAQTYPINPAITQGSLLIVDSGENVFLGGYQTNELTPAGVQTQVNTSGGNSGIGVDAAGTLYSGRYGTGGIGELPASDYATAIAYVDNSAPVLGVAVGLDGTVYAGDYNAVDKVDRSQGLFTFNSLNPNQTATPQTATLYNGGNTSLTLTSMTLTGDPDYTLTANTCTNGLVIAPGAICSVTVNFTAPHNGTFTGSITFVSNSLNVTTTQTLNLTDTVLGAYVTASPITLAFGNVTENTTSAAQTITLTNSGNLPAVVDYAFGGTTAYTFTIPTACNNIPVGGSCQLSVTLKPNTTGSFNQTGSIGISNVGSGDYPPNISVTLTGNGTPPPAPAVTLMPTSLTFSGPVGFVTPAQTVTLTNSGSAPLTSISLTLFTGGPTNFAQTANNCPATLAAGASCTASYVFQPTYNNFASQTATVYVSDNAFGSPQSIPLTGNVTTPAPAVTFNPTPVAFASQTAGTASAATVVQLTNSGTAALTIGGITIAGTNPTAFVLTTSATSPCGSTLAAAASCNISVTFEPTTAASYSASISVADNATGSPQTVPLTGTGAAAASSTVAQLQFIPSQLSVLAGTGSGSVNGTGDGGPALSATFDAPVSAVQDASGNVYIADQDANYVRKVDIHGNISAFAGVPGYGPGTYGGDNGLAINANLSNPIGLAIDAAGSVYIADYGNERIRKVVPSTGIITTFDGTGLGFFNGANAPNTIIPGPEGICFDPSGNLYIASTNASLILKISSSGAASIFAGSINSGGSGTPGYNGDNIPANTAEISFPNNVACDQAGNVYIADTNNNRIRKVAAGTGIITTVAGNGTAGANGDGSAATSAEITAWAVTTDLAGDLFITSTASGTNGSTVRKVDLSGNITTVAGGGTGGSGGEAIAMKFGGLGYTGVDNNGSLLVPSFDYSNQTDQVFSAGPSGFLQFGTVNVGSTSAPLTVTFENTGNAALALSQTTYAATGAFTVTGGTCVGLSTLASGATCTLTVTFTPTSAIAYTGSIGVNSNGTIAAQTILLAGSGGTVTAPSAVLAPNPLTFPNTTVNTSSTALPMTLSNPGNAALTITGISVVGTNASSFSQTNNCGTSVAAGGSCTILVTFTPASVGVGLSAAISVADNATGSPQSATVTGNGTVAGASQAVLNPNPLAFPNTPVGTPSATLPVTLSNPGTAALTVSGISVSGTNAGSFSQTNNCGTSVAADSSCTILVTFTPATAGALTATVSVADNATGSPQTATLTGTGTAPQAVLSPATLAFPNTALGSTATAMTTTLSNPGNATLTGISISIAGSNPSDFANASATTCGTTLAAGASCLIAVTFTPASAASFSATLSVADSATGSPQTVALTGTGTTAQAVLSPATLAFPSTTVGSTATALTATLSNPGSATLTGIAIGVAGANPSDFAETTTCGTTLAAGANCTIGVTFTPASATSFSATLSVTDSAIGSPQSAALTGTGTAPPVPQAVLSPTSLTFTNTSVGTTSAAQAITLSNPGTGTLTIAGISIAGANPSDFAETTTCGTTLAAGANCGISVAFKPLAATAFTATLSVADNASGSPQTATLSGTGIASTATFAVNSGTGAVTVRPGAVAQFTINVVSQGGSFTNAVALTAAGVPSSATYSFNPASVTPGAAGATSVLSIQTASPFIGASPELGRHANLPLLAVLTGVPLLGLASLRRRLRPPLARMLALLAFAAFLLPSLAALSGCGGGYFGPVPETYTVIVTGTSGNTQQSTTVSLTVQ